LAGIGFELRKLTRERPGLWTGMRAFAAAGMVSSGPWLLTTATLLLVGFVTDPTDTDFRALVTSAFAWSLMLVGGIQTAATRHVADLLYSRRHDGVASALLTTALLMVPVLALLGLALCWLTGLDTATTVAETTLLVVIGLQWTVMSWLGVVRRHQRILGAFLVGLLVSWGGLAALDAGPGASTAQRLLVYAGGQALTVTLLVAAVLADTRPSPARSAEALQALRRYPALVLAGALYALAIWADKLVLWSFDGVGEGVLLRCHPLYDTCAFLAYASTLPALTANLIRLETDFYESYRAYYGALLGGRNLTEIEARRDGMVQSLRRGAIRLLRAQGLVTTSCVLFAGPLVRALGLPAAAADVLRPMCVGAFLHCGLLVAMLLLLYFDRRRDAVLTALVFLVANATGAVTAVAGGLVAYGYGYAVAALLSLTWAVARVGEALEDLEYLTFRDAR
jgi:uncharacterized membrane protein